MITLLTGKKGSGKTKKLIELANAALENSKGCVVVVEKGIKLTYNISHKARLVDTNEYDIRSGGGLFGFVSGICAGNYDVTDILIDSTLKIIGPDADSLDMLVTDLKKLSETANTNIVLSVSLTEDELPDELKDLVLK